MITSPAGCSARAVATRRQFAEGAAPAGDDRARIRLAVSQGRGGAPAVACCPHQAHELGICGGALGGGWLGGWAALARIWASRVY